MNINKIPPHDEEAEEAVLGCILQDKEALLSAMETLNPIDFYRDDNKTIFEACNIMFGKGEPIDVITVSDELKVLGKLEAVGGMEYVGKLPDKVPTTANVEKYVKIVEEKSLLRNIIKTANGLIELGYKENENAEDLMESAEKQIFDMMQKRSQTGYSSITQVLVDSFIHLQELYNQKKRITGITTGFTDLDDKILGLHNSDLILVAARPSMGKTAFALNLAANAAIKGGTPVVVFSLEMSKTQCANRILCSTAMVDSSHVQKGDLTPEEWTKLAETSNQLADSAGIYIDDTAGITAAEIRAKCRKLKLEKNIGLVIIDYLQLITGNSRIVSREQQIADISRSLKILAKEINVPVIALSQLSRAPEQRDDHRPMLQDLRESGSIEQDADLVMFIYRDDYYNRDRPPTNIVEIILAKNRNGAIGPVELLWMPSFTKFADKYKGPEQ